MTLQECYDKYLPIQDKLLGMNFGSTALNCWSIIASISTKKRFVMLPGGISAEHLQIAVDGKYGSVPQELALVVRDLVAKAELMSVHDSMLYRPLGILI